MFTDILRASRLIPLASVAYISIGLLSYCLPTVNALERDLDPRVYYSDHSPSNPLSQSHVETSRSDVTYPIAALDSQHAPRDLIGVLFLQNNSPANKEITGGETQYWAVATSMINGSPGEVGTGLPSKFGLRKSQDQVEYELKKRQSTSNLYISVTVCLQPSGNSSTTNNTAAPQLYMYFSSDDANQKPGPASTGNQYNITLDSGYGLFNITPTSQIYVSVAAPNVTGYQGQWTYEIAASIDAPYHQLDNSEPFLYFVDGDTHAALLTTADLTTANSSTSAYQQWMSLRPPYGMFAQNQLDSTILGVSKSYCGLRSSALISANLQNVVNQNVVGMTNRGLGGHPKEQFYITDLSAASTYWGFLAMQGNSTMSGQSVVGGGGKVWSAMTFSTKSLPNCALMYNLTFCSEVAYAVPTNPDLFSPRTGLPALAAIYDSYAATMYQNFNYSLQQIPCNTTSSAQYSLARTCDDCAEAYKRWLCTVTIPRCEDYNNSASYLQPRNVAQPFPNGTALNPNDPAVAVLLAAVAANQSRNSIIDTQVQPGPYKEVLPCYDVCYNLVQSCPAALGFGCPRAGQGMESSYGQRSSNTSLITCSWLGAAYDLSAANRLGGSTPGSKALSLLVGVVTLIIL